MEIHPELYQYAHLVSPLMGSVPKLCRGEQRLQVVVENGLLTYAAQSKVLKKPVGGQNTVCISKC